MEQDYCWKSRFGLEFGYSKPPCGDFETPQPPDWWFMVFIKNVLEKRTNEGFNFQKLKVVDKIHYLHFGLLLWGISGIVTVG